MIRFWACLQAHLTSIQSVLLNVVGGILAALSWEFGKSLLRRLSRWKFKQVFGCAPVMYLVYGSFKVRATAVQSQFQLTKQSDPSHAFSAERVASSCEVRAAAYLSHSLSAEGKTVGLFEADDHLESRLDIDFIALGALSNQKTLDCFKNTSNDLCEFDEPRGFFVWKGTRDHLCERQQGKDCGVILKIHPQFPDRTWIACAGLGEWGTSGAAWFLAKKWEQIRERASSKAKFLAVIEVEPGKDESAVLIDIWNKRPSGIRTTPVTGRITAVGPVSDSTATFLRGE